MNWVVRLSAQASLLAAAASGLSAASISFDFSATNMGGLASTQVLYYGGVTNNGGDAYLTSESVSVNGFAVDTTPFNSNLGFLGTGSSVPFAQLFSVAIPNAVSNPYGTFTGSYNLFGGDTLGATDLLATALFFLKVVPVLPPDLAITPPVESGPPGSTLAYSGTISNSTAFILYLNALTVHPPAPTSDDSTPFLNSPLSLNPGTFEYGVPLFNIAIPGDTAPGVLSGDVLVQGGATPDAQDNVARANFDVNVTPEPSTWLLVGGGTLLAAFRRRRR